MKPLLTNALLALAILSTMHCGTPPSNNKATNTDLTAASPVDLSFRTARKGFKTRLIKLQRMGTHTIAPPPNILSLVSFPTEIGNMDAYLSKIPDDGKLHPAIIWITGGFGNGLDPVWEPADTENDQTASVFRKSGLITMYPSQRGGQMNPGHDESFLGEIDDIIAARDFLAKQKGIDSNRIYLGGHSTGGTKVLLVAEVTNKFRAVFSFAPVSYVVSYGPDALTYDFNNEDESLMRSPICWLIDIATPTYILEGNDPERSNIEELRRINKYVKKYELPLVHLFEIKNKDHFSSLYPASAILAKKILADTSANVNFEFNEELFGKVQMK